MPKFKVYGTFIWTGFVLLTIVLFLPPAYVSPSLMQLIIVILFIVYIGYYLFLFAVLSYFKEPLLKKLSVLLLLIAQYAPIFFVQVRDMPSVWLYSILLLLNVPFVMAFATIQKDQIQKLTQSLAYVMLLVAVVRLVFAIAKLDIGIYHIAYSIINLFPTIIAAIMCNKMINISGLKNEETKTVDETIDLL